jgi:hypothetical protein
MAKQTTDRRGVGNAPQDSGAKPAVEARQGVISGRVLTVLVVSLLLVIIGFGVAYLVTH